MARGLGRRRPNQERAFRFATAPGPRVIDPHRAASILLALLWLVAPLARADPPADLKAAIALFETKRYPEAHAALQAIVTHDPGNATACHVLGRTLIVRNDPAGFAEGLTWLERAVALEPGNAVFLVAYGGAALQQASRTRTLSAAKQGRDAMEKALTLDPANLDAREALIQFYQRAPWPLGSAAKAAAHLEGLRQRDPDRALSLDVLARASAKEFPAAFGICDAALAKNPDQYGALYQYGRTASVSGLNLERGLACLQRCLALPPPSPASPTHSHVWQRIGNLQEKLQRPADARRAYETALQLDVGNRQATEALARLR